MKKLNEMKNQSISLDKVHRLFRNLEEGDGVEFFTQLTDDTGMNKSSVEHKKSRRSSYQ